MLTVTEAEVTRWLDDYYDAWRAADSGAASRLFTEASSCVSLCAVAVAMETDGMIDSAAPASPTITTLRQGATSIPIDSVHV